MEQQIKLVQVPVIQHKLVEVGASVTLRIEELNLSNLVATDDTIKGLKSLRAELNAEFTDYENQRKALKQAVANPYMEFEKVYESEISGKYKQAVELLKDKISVFENNVKAEKKANIESYFCELCLDAKIDFLKFEHTGLEINLSTSEKQYKEKCADFVNRVADDVILIQGIEYPAETMAEYKKTLNASKAITTVRERMEQERLEKERIKTIETNRRTAMLRGLSMVYMDMTKSYNWIEDETVYILHSEVESVTKDEFNKAFTSISEIIKTFVAEKAEIERQRLAAIKAEVQPELPLQTPIVVEKPKQAPAPLQAPVEVLPERKPIEKLVEASFTCKGTMSKLTALGQYMRDNGIIYTNI
jgi:hypothetical protein